MKAPSGGCHSMTIPMMRIRRKTTSPADHATQPAFLRRLTERFMQLGFAVFDGDFEIPIRTWFIDHVTMRRWTSPRILQLVGPPHTWEQQFSSIWVDQINPDDWFDLSIVDPDPPRTAQASVCHDRCNFDAITAYG